MGLRICVSRASWFHRTQRSAFETELDQKILYRYRRLEEFVWEYFKFVPSTKIFPICQGSKSAQRFLCNYQEYWSCHYIHQMVEKYFRNETDEIHLKFTCGKSQWKVVRSKMLWIRKNIMNKNKKIFHYWQLKIMRQIYCPRVYKT